MNIAFEKSFKLILAAEGGYTDHPMDHGGPTNLGITISTLSSYLGRAATVNDVKSLTVAGAKEIYLKKYWNAMHLDLIANETLQLLLMDQAVNCGNGACTKRIQKVVGTSQTLHMDVETIKAINVSDSLKTCFEFIKATQDFYVNIVKNKPEQKVFLAGWINRSQKLLDIVRDNVQFK